MQVTGLTETQREMQAVQARLRDLTPVLTVLAADIRTLIDDSFENSRDPSGQSWQPLQPKTVQRKGSAKPLIDTGVLRSSITTAVAPKSLSVGSRVVYAATQNFGRGAIPARRYMVSTADTNVQRLVSDTVSNYIATGRITP